MKISRTKYLMASLLAANALLMTSACTKETSTGPEQIKTAQQNQQLLARYVREFPGVDGPERPIGPYEYEERLDLDVPMRDGVVLKTDLFLPVGAGQVPMLLMRTPYDSKGFHPDRSRSQIVTFLVQHGYAVAVQNVRGKYGSQGDDYTPSLSDDTDTYDTMEWATKQDWFADSIGTLGCSYLGESQVMAAVNPHPAWKAAIPRASGGANFDLGGLNRPFAYWNGGAVELAQTLSWFIDHGEHGASSDAVEQVDRLALMNKLPISGALKSAGFAGTDYEDFVTSPPPASDYWKDFPYLREGQTIKVPSLFIDGLYDYGPHDVALQYEAARASEAHPSDVHRILFSPATHCMEPFLTKESKIGDLDIGDPRFDYRQLYLDWFDHHLKGEGPGLGSIPATITYLLGANRWEAHNSWPPAAAKPAEFFLSVDGALDNAAGKPGELSYIYDPNDPVPTVGSPVCCVPEINGQSPQGAYDQAPLNDRDDILRFQTDALAKDTIVSGPVEAVLYVSSSAVDTDFTAKLIDVHPDGTAYNVLDGIQRMRWRKLSPTPSFMERGEVYEVRVHLQATNMMFKKGHRLRLDISSSNFPRFDRNMNVRTLPSLANEGVVATNTVHFSEDYPSRLLLHIRD